MPLFHIHGLSVNVLATLLAGAAVVCERKLEPVRFFHRLIGSAPTASAVTPPAATWYSAVPTMHQAVLMAGEGGGPCAPMLDTWAGEVLALAIARNCSAALLPAVSARLVRVSGLISFASSLWNACIQS